MCAHPLTPLPFADEKQGKLFKLVSLITGMKNSLKGGAGSWDGLMAHSVAF